MRSWGTCDMNESNSACPRTAPVGLLGEHSSTSPVSSVIACAIAGRSWRPSAVSGTATWRAPLKLDSCGYISKDGHG